MRNSFILVLLSFFITHLAWAGLGPVNITEMTLASEREGEISTPGLIAPLATIEPSGSGHIVFVDQSVSTTVANTVIGRLYVQSIDEFNQLQEPVLLDEHTNSRVPLVTIDIETAENGNALLFYSKNNEDPEVEDEDWTVYYDAQTGWRQPIQLPIDTQSAEILIGSAGETYAVIKPTTSNLRNLYQYQSNNTWLLVSESTEESIFGLGADNRLYRIYDVNVVGTGTLKYISFFDTSNNQWQTPIVLNQDAEGNVSQSIYYVNVTDGGDIFTLEYTIVPTPLRVNLSVRKYEVDTGSWQDTPDVFEPPYDASVALPLMYDFVPVETTNDASTFMGLVLISSSSDNDVWHTVHYNEQTGWQIMQTLHDLQNELDFHLVYTKNNSFASAANGKSHYISASDTGNAMVIFCHNNCVQFYAKQYSDNSGWSNELYIPALGTGADNRCGIPQSSLTFQSPQFEFHPNGNMIGVSQVMAGVTANEQRTYLVTVTGDMLTATSDTSCPVDSTDPEPEPPVNDDPDPGNDGGDNGGGDNGTDPGTDTSGGTPGGSSGGSLGLPMIIIFLFLFRGRLLASVRVLCRERIA